MASHASGVRAPSVCRSLTAECLTFQGMNAVRRIARLTMTCVYACRWISAE
jgi:hypothetical protein